jgi:hypothetical protein
MANAIARVCSVLTFHAISTLNFSVASAADKERERGLVLRAGNVTKCADQMLSALPPIATVERTS